MTLEELAEKCKAERDKVINNALAEEEAFVERWLVSRGWDGKDREQARQLSKGWTVLHEFNDGKMTLRIVKMPTIYEDNGRVFFVDENHRINLTSAFGAGNEPRTLEEVDKALFMKVSENT